LSTNSSNNSTMDRVHRNSTPLVEMLLNWTAEGVQFNSIRIQGPIIDLLAVDFVSLVWMSGNRIWTEAGYVDKKREKRRDRERSSKRLSGHDWIVGSPFPIFWSPYELIQCPRGHVCLCATCRKWGKEEQRRTKRQMRNK
jgi:hypothetical protein